MNPPSSVPTHRTVIKLCSGIHAPPLLHHPPFFFSKTPPSVLWYVIYCHFKRHKSVFSASEEWLWSHIPSSSEQPPVFSFWYSLSTRFLNVPQCSVCLSLPHFSSEHSSSLSQALVSLFLTHTYGKNYSHDSNRGSCPWQLLAATMKTEPAENVCVSCIYVSMREFHSEHFPCLWVTYMCVREKY